MTLENQVVSLELAKKMKELGFKQESLFYWSFYDGGNSNVKPGIIFTDEANHGFEEDLISSYTVAELGEMLPKEINMPFKNGKPRERNNSLKSYFGRGTGKGYISVVYGRTGVYDGIFIKANTEADARAKMLVYLKENNLLG